MNKDAINGLTREVTEKAESHMIYVDRLRREYQNQWSARYLEVGRHDEAKSRSMITAAYLALAAVAAPAVLAGVAVISPGVAVVGLGSGLAASLACIGKGIYHDIAKNTEYNKLGEARTNEDLIAADKARSNPSTGLWDKAMDIIRGGHVFMDVAEDQPSHQRATPRPAG